MLADEPMEFMPFYNKRYIMTLTCHNITFCGQNVAIEWYDIAI